MRYYCRFNIIPYSRWNSAVLNVLSNNLQKSTNFLPHTQLKIKIRIYIKCIEKKNWIGICLKTNKNIHIYICVCIYIYAYIHNVTSLLTSHHAFAFISQRERERKFTHIRTLNMHTHSTVAMMLTVFSAEKKIVFVIVLVCSSSS